ncbi:MAG: hypothetical protein HZC52_01455 [Planctomycetes bacterium]|nr:hypothetical protein [Planctomycetota bacterium]
MSLSVSQKSSFIIQSEIRAMTIVCAKLSSINLAQGVSETPWCLWRSGGALRRP